jgi:hypothetical protein
MRSYAVLRTRHQGPANSLGLSHLGDTGDGMNLPRVAYTEGGTL